MKTLQDYTKLPVLRKALIQLDRDFDRKLISLSQLLEFNEKTIDYFYKKL